MSTHNLFSVGHHTYLINAASPETALEAAQRAANNSIYHQRSFIIQDLADELMDHDLTPAIFEGRLMFPEESLCGGAWEVDMTRLAPIDEQGRESCSEYIVSAMRFSCRMPHANPDASVDHLHWEALRRSLLERNDMSQSVEPVQDSKSRPRL